MPINVYCLFMLLHDYAEASYKGNNAIMKQQITAVSDILIISESSLMEWHDSMYIAYMLNHCEWTAEMTVSGYHRLMEFKYKFG